MISLVELSRQRRYWMILILVGVALEAAALYYQYALDEWPCVLCIHVRLWIAALILLGLIALISGGSDAVLRGLHGLNVIIMIGLVERSWRVLAVERGWIFGDCDMSLGTPAWFAPDRWFPYLFEVQTSCGYTPLILFEISMAELLLVISGLLLIISAATFAASWVEFEQ